MRQRETAGSLTGTSHTKDTREMTRRTAAATMLRYPEQISDGLEAELCALLEQLGPLETSRPASASQPDGPS